VIDASGNAIIIVEEELPVDTYFITFDSNGGTPVGSMEKAYGDPITPPPAPTRDGYVFIGWTPELPTYMPNYDFTVTATWDPAQYYVTFYGNEGIPNETTKTIYYGDKYSTIMTTPSRTGHQFVGWSTTATGPGEIVNPSDTYSLFGNQTLYARWSIEQYTVQFDTHGGGSNPADIKVNSGSTYGTLPVLPDRTGYDFNGWYTQQTGGNKVTSDTVVTANHTLHAQWTAKTYTVTLYRNHSNSDPNYTTTTVTHGGKYANLPEPQERTGYKFNGWYTGQTNGNLVDARIDVTPNSPRILYAHWEEDDDGGVTCPFVYSFDGKDYHFEHESIPATISSSLETTSYGTLRKEKAIDGVYNVRIAEKQEEISFVNGFSFYAVDYLKNSGVEYVKADIFGKPHTIADKQYPLSMKEKTTGKDVLYEITTEGVSASTDFMQINTKDFITQYEVKFKKPSNEAETGKFMITTQCTHYASMLGQYYWDKIDAQTHFWWIEKLLNLPGMKNQAKDFMKVVMMTVEVWDGKQWVEQGNIKAGGELMEELLIPIDLSLIDSKTDEVIIRLSHGAGLFEIETVSMDYSINQINSVKELKISSALLNGETDVYNDLINHNDNKRTKMIMGDTIDLQYVAPELDENMSRGYYVALSGYYYMDPDVREVSDIISEEDKSIISKIKSVFDAFMEINKDNISTVKWILGLVKDSYNKPLETKIELMIKSQYDDFLEFIKNRK
jgi:uncharacterized repeat protein (TIGR02543 family)